jgi:hypothetical protein
MGGVRKKYKQPLEKRGALNEHLLTVFNQKSLAKCAVIFLNSANDFF